jgi:hypothetical protein
VQLFDRWGFRERSGDHAKVSQRVIAKSRELRALTSPARLLESRSKRDDGRAMDVEIYEWFTEAFDTADLNDAKALLDELKN